MLGPDSFMIILTIERERPFLSKKEKKEKERPYRSREKVYAVFGIPDQHPVGVSCSNKNSTPV